MFWKYDKYLILKSNTTVFALPVSSKISFLTFKFSKNLKLSIFKWVSMEIS